MHCVFYLKWNGMKTSKHFQIWQEKMSLRSLNGMGNNWLVYWLSNRWHYIRHTRTHTCTQTPNIWHCLTEVNVLTAPLCCCFPFFIYISFTRLSFYLFIKPLKEIKEEKKSTRFNVISTDFSKHTHQISRTKLKSKTKGNQNQKLGVTFLLIKTEQRKGEKAIEQATELKVLIDKNGYVVNTHTNTLLV